MIVGNEDVLKEYKDLLDSVLVEGFFENEMELMKNNKVYIRGKIYDIEAN